MHVFRLQRISYFWEGSFLIDVKYTTLGKGSSSRAQLKICPFPQYLFDISALLVCNICTMLQKVWTEMKPARKKIESENQPEKAEIENQPEILDNENQPEKNW